MPVVKPISDQTRANYHSGTRRSHSTCHHAWLRRPHQQSRAPLETSEDRGGSDASLEISPPPCNHPVNHSGAVEFYRDAVAPGAPLC